MSWRSFAIVNKTDTPKMSPIKPVRAAQNPGGLVFVFTGQGAQYAKMGSELLAYPVFRNVVSRASAVMEKLGADWLFMGMSERFGVLQDTKPILTPT